MAVGLLRCVLGGVLVEVSVRVDVGVGVDEAVGAVVATIGIAVDVADGGPVVGGVAVEVTVKLWSAVASVSVYRFTSRLEPLWLLFSAHHKPYHLESPM